MKHEVNFDRAGWGQRARITCYTCGKTLMCQPYMTPEWRERKVKFLVEHSPASAEENKK